MCLANHKAIILMVLLFSNYKIKLIGIPGASHKTN